MPPSSHPHPHLVLLPDASAQDQHLWGWQPCVANLIAVLPSLAHQVLSNSRHTSLLVNKSAESSPTLRLVVLHKVGFRNRHQDRLSARPSPGLSLKPSTHRRPCVMHLRSLGRIERHQRQCLPKNSHVRSIHDRCTNGRISRHIKPASVRATKSNV
jgi:hypothetical protein